MIIDNTHIYEKLEDGLIARSLKLWNDSGQNMFWSIMMIMISTRRPKRLLDIIPDDLQVN